VKIWTDTGLDLESDWAFFETAKLTEPLDASWIRADLGLNKNPYFRKEFTVPSNIEWARVYVCGLGVYELYINDHKVGNDFLMPGYHSYNFFVQYQTYDIEEYLEVGVNCIGAMLGRGWYKGRFAGGLYDSYGDTIQLICEVRIRCTDKTEVIVCSNPDWLGHISPVGENGIYDGEIYDARLEIPGWSQPGCPSEGWLPGILTGRSVADLVERVNPPLTIHERLKPEKVIRNEKGQTLLDFGQEITGWVEFRVNSVMGTQITISLCEILQNNEFCRDTLRRASGMCVFTANGFETI
jgi:alpha-L-rhamnosidase